jgi:hypothetical protein
MIRRMRASFRHDAPLQFREAMEFCNMNPAFRTGVAGTALAAVHGTARKSEEYHWSRNERRTTDPLVRPAIKKVSRQRSPFSAPSRETLRSEAGQRLALVLKSGNNVWQADYSKHSLDPTARTEQFQATALTAKVNMCPDDGADAPTIQPCHVSKVQQQLLRAVVDQPL